MTEPPFRSRSFVAVPPEQRPVRTRSAARVIVTDFERVLLLSDSDPGVAGSRWWITPGGGVDPGEQPLQAAVREVAEETGLVVEPGSLDGPLLRRFVVHGYSDQVLGQSELFYLLRVPAPFDLDTSGFTNEEKLTIASWDWLLIDDLAATVDPVWPVDLPALIDLAQRPEAWPLDGGLVEESTVVAGGLAERAALDWAGLSDR